MSHYPTQDGVSIYYSAASDLTLLLLSNAHLYNNLLFAFLSLCSLTITATAASFFYNDH